jgi:molybdopterin-guanine dinucleotide biosynthesis protein A
MSARPLLAVFVGGKSRRMGTPKGLLEAPGSGSPILERLVALGREHGLRVVLVGDATPYATLAEGVPRIADDPPGAGPLAGLHAALSHAAENHCKRVIAVACDMPFVSAEALSELLDHPSDAAVVAARRASDAPWEPMLARYDAPALVGALRAALAGGQRSFQQLFASLEVETLPLSPAVDRALRDWDTPEDIGA